MTGGVTLAYVTGGRVTSRFHLSVVQTLMAHQGLIVGHLGVEGPYIAQNRNHVVRDFLPTTAEWLWFVDDDIVLTTNTLPALLEHADGKPILGACYFGNEGNAMWAEARGGDPYAPFGHVEPKGLYRLSAVGMGCTLIHRSVLEAMQSEVEPDPWFGHDLVPDGQQGYRTAGEDTTFCQRAARFGFHPWGLGFVVGHLKTDLRGWDHHG